MAISVRDVHLQRPDAAPQLGLKSVVAGRCFIVQGRDVAKAAERAEGIGIIAAGYRQIRGDLPTGGSAVVHAVDGSGSNRLTVGVDALRSRATIGAAYRRI